MPDVARSGPVWDAARRFLEQAYGVPETDSEGNFVLRRDGIVVWVRVIRVDDTHSAVLVWCVSNVGVRVDGALTHYLATEDLDLPFCQFELHREVPAVTISHGLLGEYLSREELVVVVDEVAAAARHHGPRIRDHFGGSLAPTTATATVGTGPATTATTRAGGLQDIRQIAGRIGSRSSAGAMRAPEVEGRFGIAAILGGFVAAAAVYLLASSWWLAAFAFLMALQVIGQLAMEVLTEPDKARRAAFFGMVPFTCTAILLTTYWLWGEWWLAVVLGLVVGALLATVIDAVAFADLFREESAQAEQQQRQRRGYFASGPTS